ncbi:45684_t:CDS:2, partial [Gigaspora margarita]
MSNWPSPNSEIHHLLCKLPSESAGYLPGPLWQAFNLVKTNKNKKLKASYIKKCEKVHLNIRIYLINAYNFQQKSVQSIPIRNSQNFNQQLPIDACKSNQLLLEAIIECARKQLSNNIDNVYKNVQASIQQFIANQTGLLLQLVKIKDTLGKSQTSIAILRDLEESLTQIDIEKVNAVITVGAANYVRMKTMLIQKYPKIVALLCIAHESNLLVGD